MLAPDGMTGGALRLFGRTGLAGPMAPIGVEKPTSARRSGHDFRKPYIVGRDCPARDGGVRREPELISPC